MCNVFSTTFILLKYIREAIAIGRYMYMYPEIFNELLQDVFVFLFLFLL